MSDGTEPMFEDEPESTWNPQLAFSGGDSGVGRGDMVSLDANGVHRDEVDGDNAGSGRVVGGEIGVHAVPERFSVEQGVDDRDGGRGLTTARSPAGRTVPAGKATAATTSSQSDPIATNRTADTSLRQCAQEYPPTTRSLLATSSPMRNPLPKPLAISPALHRGGEDRHQNEGLLGHVNVKQHEDMLGHINSGFVGVRNVGRFGVGPGLPVDGNSQVGGKNETHSFELPMPNVGASGCQSGGMPAPGLLPRSSTLDTQGAGLSGGIKKKKAARARVGDLLPENIHSCPFEGCNKKFAKKYNLKIHVRRHAGDLPFQCELPNCQKRFMWHSSFQRHQRSHLRKPKGKRKKMSGAGGNEAGPSSGPSLDASMIPTQLLLGNGTGPEVPESILSALVNAGGGSPFDESSALHSAQLFCTGPAIELAGPIYDASALRPEQKRHRHAQQSLGPQRAVVHQPDRVENNQHQLTINDYTSISAIESTAQNLKAAAKDNQEGASGMHQSAPPFSHLSTPCGVESNSRNLSAPTRMMSTHALPPSAHSAPATQMFSNENDISRLFSPMSTADALGLNFLQAGLDEPQETTNFTNTDIPTAEILPPNTFPNLPATSSPTSGTSVPAAAQASKHAKEVKVVSCLPAYSSLPEQTQPMDDNQGQAHFGVEDFDESLAFLLDSIREP